jgi:hypothetical protein
MHPFEFQLHSEPNGKRWIGVDDEERLKELVVGSAFLEWRGSSTCVEAVQRGVMEYVTRHPATVEGSPREYLLNSLTTPLVDF